MSNLAAVLPSLVSLWQLMFKRTDEPGRKPITVCDVCYKEYIDPSRDGAVRENA